MTTENKFNRMHSVKYKMETVIISRTDGIGDVVLTLPMASILKDNGVKKVIFIGKKYTRDIIATSESVDLFLDWDEIEKSENPVSFLAKLQADAIVHVFPNKKIARLAAKAKIPVRIGTSHRIFHLVYCNKLVSFSRKNSDLHEAILNLNLLKPFISVSSITKEMIPQLFRLAPDAQLSISEAEAKIVHSFLDTTKINLILHPRSQGSAREWGLDNYSSLINLLESKNFNVIVTGTNKEAESMKEFLYLNDKKIINATGKISLAGFIHLINSADALVAASTGPLHIAAALGKVAIGLYAPMRPIFPTRWAPLGNRAHILVVDKKCNACKKGGACSCIQSLPAMDVVNILEGEFPEIVS